MTEGRISPDGRSVIYNHPTLEGISCEVQHSVESQKPYTNDLGKVGVGVVTLPTGQPRLIMQTKHADGTSVAAIMIAADAVVVLECLLDAMAAAQALAEASDQARRQ